MASSNVTQEKPVENLNIQGLIDTVDNLLKQKNLEQKESINRRNNDSNNQSHLDTIRKQLDEVKNSLVELKKLEEGELGKRIQPHLRHLEELILNARTTVPGGFLPLVHNREITKEIMKIKNKIPSLHKLSSTGSRSYNNPQTNKGSNSCTAFQGQLNPHNSTSFNNSSFYKKIEEIYNCLGCEKSFFLSFFAVLPENAMVNRRFLTYWWVGEGLAEAPETRAKTLEECVDEILDDFMGKGLIEPAKKEKGRVKTYRMHPLVRFAMIKLSNKKIFAYDDKENLPVNLSDSNRACIIKTKEASRIRQEIDAKTIQKKFEEECKNLNQENFIALFNVSEPFPDLKLQLLAKMKDISMVEWLSKMKKVKVLYLGKWQISSTYHIEVESIEFLKGLKTMKELRLLSLQGISRINQLPSCIDKLSNLMIIDVKECHNLEVLPKEVSLLKNLRYMDVSDCYLLDRMPRGLSSLSKLTVLKGFVIGNPQSGSSGTLDDLKGLRKLRKLTISTSSNEFPTENDLVHLNNLEKESFES